MDVRFVTADGVEQHQVDDLKALLEREDGFVWLDIPLCDEPAGQLLSEVFGFHPIAVRDCQRRNHVPRIHIYPDHTFLILHAPELGEAGHVHLLELDQFVGSRYLVTVHGPLNPAVPPELAMRETEAVLRRIEGGRLRPDSPVELSYTIVSMLARRQETLVSDLAVKVAALEARVMKDPGRDPEQLLEELFVLRHELLTIRTMAAQAGEIYGRMVKLTRLLPPGGELLVEDLSDQFERVRSLCDGEKEFLHGIVEFYQSRTDTKMNHAMERLAVLAVVTLPITALASIYGMNVIVSTQTHIVHLTVVLVIMLVMSAALLRWAHRQGWW